MAAAVQVDVDDDNAAVVDCEPTPAVVMEVFGCTNDDVTTDKVVVVAFEVVIVNVVAVALDILL